MKNLLLILLVLISLSGFSQDYILKKDGKEINCWITEINLNNIVYKDTVKTDTTFYRINKSEVFLIKFRNGIKEIYGAETKKEEPVLKNEAPKKQPALSIGGLLHEGPIVDIGSNDYTINGKVYHFKYIRRLLLSFEDPEIKRLLGKSRANTIVGNILAYSSIPVGYIGFAVGVISQDPYTTDDALVPAAIALGATCMAMNVTNIILKVNKRVYIRRAIEVYNDKITALQQK